MRLFVNVYLESGKLRAYHGAYVEATLSSAWFWLKRLLLAPGSGRLLVASAWGVAEAINIWFPVILLWITEPFHARTLSTAKRDLPT